MQARFNWTKEEYRGAFQAMHGLEQFVRGSGLDKKLIELIKIRCSQINGCAYCLDMHTKDARAAGETEQRIYALSAWRETPFYTDRERAALEWAECMTLISERGIPEGVYHFVQAEFTEEEILKLSMAVVAINGWNRLAIASKTEPGGYQPQSTAA